MPYTSRLPADGAIRMTVGRQVIAGYLAVVVLTLAVVAVATGALGQVGDAKDLVINREAALVADAHRLDAAVSERTAVERGYYLTRREADRSRVTEIRGAYDEALADLEGNVYTEAGRRLLDQVRTAEKAWHDAADQVIAMAEGGASNEEVTRVAEREVFPRREVLRSAVKQFVDREEKLIAEGTRRSDDQASRALLVLWLLAAAAMAVAVAVAVVITRRISERLGTLARAVDGSASEILAGTSQQVSGFTQQAAAVQETVATVEELVQTADQSAQRARTVADRAQRSAEVAQDGIAAVDGSAQGMQAIREQVHTIAQSVVSLAERAQDISDIIDAVNEIAEQTHLLSLNAAIEAARAGEHGKGFGVVAGEVKALAEQSRRSTSRVREILVEIQRGTNSAVMLTEAGTKSADEGMLLVARAGETITELAGTVSDATVAAEQIAASSGQQAAATAQISQAMRDVDSVMEQNLSTARQAEQAARDLNEVALKMKRLVGVGE